MLKRQKRPPCMLLNARLLAAIAKRESAEAIAAAMLALAEHHETGKEPDIPSAIYLELVPDVDEGLENYLAVSERNALNRNCGKRKNAVDADGERSEAKAESVSVADGTPVLEDGLTEAVNLAKSFCLPTNAGDLQTMKALADEYGRDMLIKAIKVTGDASQEKRSWGYVRGTLNNMRAGTCKPSVHGGYEQHPDTELAQAEKEAAAVLLKQAQAFSS